MSSSGLAGYSRKETGISFCLVHMSQVSATHFFYLVLARQKTPALDDFKDVLVDDVPWCLLHIGAARRLSLNAREPEVNLIADKDGQILFELSLRL